MVVDPDDIAVNLEMLEAYTITEERQNGKLQ